VPILRVNFLTKYFIGNKVIIRGFGGFDWLSSISGSNVMAKKRQKN